MLPSSFTLYSQVSFFPSRRIVLRDDKPRLLILPEFLKSTFQHSFHFEIYNFSVDNTICFFGSQQKSSTKLTVFHTSDTVSVGARLSVDKQKGFNAKSQINKKHLNKTTETREIKEGNFSLFTGIFVNHYIRTILRVLI